jgi:hypothetical protein
MRHNTLIPIGVKLPIKAGWNSVTGFAFSEFQVDQDPARGE